MPGLAVGRAPRRRVGRHDIPDHAQQKVGSGFGARSTAEDVLSGVDPSGKPAVVTGGYAGPGLETTRAFSPAGARFVVPARRPKPQP